MKMLLFSALLCLLFISCHKEYEGEEAILISDCTGSYLRFPDSDLKICNQGLVSDYASGTTVKVKYIAIDTCTTMATEFCDMLHSHAGWIRIEQISSR